MSSPAILVLHGITMNGASMLRNLGDLGEALQRSGFELVAPDGAKSMTREEALGLARSLAGAYQKAGQDVFDWFAEGGFWDDDRHFDWLDSFTSEPDGKKAYRALDASLEAIAAFMNGCDVRGVLGFSQGCVLAAIVSALGRRGELPGGDQLRFGIYMSGFLPVFDEPARDLWPVPGDFSSRFVIGGQDPMFVHGRETIEQLAAQFPASDREVIVDPRLGHEVPNDPGVVANLVECARSHL